MANDKASKNCILTAEIAKRKLRRMAFEISEHNADEKMLFLAGITGNGMVLAERLLQELQSILSIKVELLRISLNKKEPLEVTVDKEADFTNQVIIVVDDVSNTGKTLLYSLKPFLSYLPKKIQTLVLVERSHKLFAIQPDYVGLTVGTTLQEHILVETEGMEIKGAWLY